MQKWAKCPKVPRSAQNAQKCPEVPKMPRSAQNAQKCPELPKMPKSAQNCPKCPKVPKMPKSAQKCPKCPKVPRIAQKCPELTKVPKIAQNIFLPENSKGKFFLGHPVWQSKIIQHSEKLSANQYFHKILILECPIGISTAPLRIWLGTPI